MIIARIAAVLTLFKQTQGCEEMPSRRSSRVSAGNCHHEQQRLRTQKRRSERQSHISFPKFFDCSAARRWKCMRDPHSYAWSVTSGLRKGRNSRTAGVRQPAVPAGEPSGTAQGSRCARPARPGGQASPKELLCAAGASSFTPPLAAKRLSITHNTLAQKVWEILHLWKHSGTSACSS